MSEMDDKSIIIIKKVKKGHGGHHGGAWKVAFADFVTAMMALFIVLWVLGQDEEIKQGVAGYFKDPVGFANKQSIIGASQTPAVVDMGIMNEAAQREAEKDILNKLAEKLTSELAEDEALKNFIDKIKFEIADEGLRIEMLESSDNVFFEVGTSTLNNTAKNLLKKIGESISHMPNKIIIEGHTDSRPFAHGRVSGFTNFELSTDRANSARRALVVSGVSDEQIDQIRGYADKRLRDKTDPYSLVNRRISIILKFSEFEK